MKRKQKHIDQKAINWVAAKGTGRKDELPTIHKDPGNIVLFFLTVVKYTKTQLALLSFPSL